MLPRLLLTIFLLVSPAVSPAESPAESTESAEIPETEQTEGDTDSGTEPFNSDPSAFQYQVLPEETHPSTGSASNLDFLNRSHSVVSEGVETVAKYMDIFFADEKIYDEATKTYVILSGQTIIDEHGQDSYSGKLKIKIDLPQTKRKLKLLLESDTEELQTGVERDASTSPGKAATESRYYAALQQELAKLRGWKFTTALGMKLNIPLDPFFRLRAARRYRFNNWNMHFTETLFWFDSLGAGSSTVIELDRKIGEGSLFRSGTSAIWRDETNGYDFKQSFTMYHELSKHRAVSLTLETEGRSDPTIHATSYLAYFRYRQRVHKDWLYFEIRPEVLYERETNFHPSPSLILQLDIVFGEKYTRSQQPEQEPDDEE
ncbi:MAG: hypothetical protein OEY07_14630 [Gammaproteobacteria bacterium]|nr:hypothetical protein [Gammaproteobacteria bacterium]